MFMFWIYSGLKTFFKPNSNSTTIYIVFTHWPQSVICYNVQAKSRLLIYSYLNAHSAAECGEKDPEKKAFTMYFNKRSSALQI